MDIASIRNHLKNFEFQKLFVESLGWNNPQVQSSSIKLENSNIPYTHVAEISGVPVLKFEYVAGERRKKIHNKIKQKYHKHLLLFSNDKSFYLSYLSKEGDLRTHNYFKEQSGDAFISKLASIHFGIEDVPKISEIANNLDKAFDTEKVTKKFYEDFKNNHFSFQKYISGIKSEEDKKWYSSIILNRLMFIWFLQKKDFCDNNRSYLETKLQESKVKGKDRYHSEFLNTLFFEGFAKKTIERSEKAKNLLGKIKYLNGGLFIPHEIEEKYRNIKIKDKAFEETFKIFQNYEWHLQDNKGKDNEISPDVLGYIFEKYINEIQQKSLGAYYTRDEITGFLNQRSIHNCILDKLAKRGHKFSNIGELFEKLDDKMCKILLTDKDSILNTLTILDPAVGSGAFLVSALKNLIDVYSPIIGKIETSSDRELKAWLENFNNRHKSILYGIKKNIILKNLYGVDIMKEATEVCKLRLFLSLVSSALDSTELEPLPNMDFNIMHGNSLIGFLKEKNTNEQFSLFGESYSQIKEKYNKLVNQYKNKSLSFEKLKELKQKVSKFLEENNSNLNQVLSDKCDDEGLKYEKNIDVKGKKTSMEKQKRHLKEGFDSLRPFHWDFSFNEIIDKGGFDIIITNPPWEKVKIEDKEFFCKYDDSFSIKRTPKNTLKKNKEKLLKNNKIKKDYLRIKSTYRLQRDYFSKVYSYQSDNITNVDGSERKSSSDIENYRLFIERCFNLLNKNGFLGIVLPRGFCCDEGSFGIRRHVLEESKIKALITFVNKGKERIIFEGVGSTVQFLLLNLKKDKPQNQEKFSCQFRAENLGIINNFPNENTIEQSFEEIQKFSPRDCSIIEFKHPKEKEMLKKVSKFPKLEEKLENSWMADFYREFDETNDSALFKNKQSSDSLPLYKGAAIYQYEFNKNLSCVDRYISKNSNKVRTGTGKAFKNQFYKDHRIVIRTIVSTGSVKLISSIIPKNYFITNSLHGVYIKSKETSKNNQYMLFLQAFLNSFLLNYFISQKIYLNVNLKHLRDLHIPRLTEKDSCFKELVKKSAELTCIGKEFNDLADEIGIKRGGVKNQQTRYKIQAEIDAIVASVYGLTIDEYEYILGTFKTGKNQERLQTLKKLSLEFFKEGHSCLKAS